MSVTLRPMRPDEYPAWAEEGERGYVYQMVEFGGMEREHAAAKAVVTSRRCCQRASRRRTTG
jgi:hypothetical protein